MENETADEVAQEPIDEVVEESTAEEIEAEGSETLESEDEDGVPVVVFGDEEVAEESTGEPAPEWVRDLRKTNREQAREIAALKKATAKADEKPSQLSARPTLEQAGYDEEEHAARLDDWYAEKRKFDQIAEAERAKAEDQQKAWQSRLDEYNKAKSSFDPDTVEDAEAVARSALSETQQGVLIEALGEKAAPLIVGLAANDKRLKDLASIANPIRFAAEAARLESIMKTTTRRPKTAPEKRVVGSGSAPVGAKTLEQLEAEAERTGNRTAVIAYKKQQRLAKS